MKIYQVQAQVSGVTHDGWHSSRQVRTMTVAAPSESDAAQMVSDLAWDMTQTRYQGYRRTYAQVCPMQTNHDGALVPFPGKWVRVTYSRGWIETLLGDTYESVRHVPSEELDDNR